jgi:ABC-type dipeptide/oligopeptide/nickel transport system ATPase subunit
MPTVSRQSNVASKNKGGGIASRIVPVAQAARGFTMALYGRSGSGKTRLSCTFPKPLLLLGAEEGTGSVSTKVCFFYRC